MNTDAPFPRTLAALRRLNARQMEFCHRLIAGEYGTAAYRAAYGTTTSRCTRKAAAKIKAGRAVQEYLGAKYEELYIRDRINHEATNQAIANARKGFDKSSFIANRLAEARQHQLQNETHNKPLETSAPEA